MARKQTPKTRRVLSVGRTCEQGAGSVWDGEPLALWPPTFPGGLCGAFTPGPWQGRPQSPISVSNRAALFILLVGFAASHNFGCKKLKHIKNLHLIL